MSTEPNGPNQDLTQSQVATVEETDGEDAEGTADSVEEAKMEAPVVPQVPIKIAEKTKSIELKKETKIDNVTVKKLDSDATPIKPISQKNSQ